MWFRGTIWMAALLIVSGSIGRAAEATKVPRTHGLVAPLSASPLSNEEMMHAVRSGLDSAIQDVLAKTELGGSSETNSRPGAFEAWDARSSVSDPRRDRGVLGHPDNEELRAWTIYFSGGGRVRLEAAVRRVAPFRERVMQILESFGLPRELIVVAFIESEFVSNAVSPKGATGPWQFMPVTAIRYGLQRDAWRDDRMDFEKSTLAAAQYLRDLHQLFGDWPLALAAYNAGEDRVLAAAEKGGSRDFWALTQRGLLPIETATYVPKILGAARAWAAADHSEFEKTAEAKRDSRQSQNPDWFFASTSGE